MVQRCVWKSPARKLRKLTGNRPDVFTARTPESSESSLEIDPKSLRHVRHKAQKAHWKSTRRVYGTYATKLRKLTGNRPEEFTARTPQSSESSLEIDPKSLRHVRHKAQKAHWK